MTDNLFVLKHERIDTVNFATVTGIHADGLAIRLDGETTASSKHYKCNTSILFAVGDRVRIIRDSGTYVVEYAVGNPRTS